MGYLFALMLGFIAGAFLTRKSVWKVIEGKAKFAVVPKPEADKQPEVKA